MPPNTINENEVMICTDHRSSGSTKTIHASNGITYYHCTSKDAFELPYSKKQTAEQVNQSLHLNLGLTMIDPWNPTLRKILRRIVDAGRWMELLLIALWIKIPLMFRHWLVQNAWMMYFVSHRIVLGRSTGIHPDASLEYHALTSVLWWTRLFPATVERIRFSLNQIQVQFPPSIDINAQTITIADAATNTSISATVNTNFEQQQQQQDSTCCGVYVSLKTEEEESTTRPNKKKKVIFWLYGGAFLGGDIEGNLGNAEKIGIQCNADAVFIANYRLLPEHELQDACDDVYRAYEWLVTIDKPEHIIIYGISSGGGLALTLVQQLVAQRKSHLLPAGMVLMCPFVDYTEPQGSMLHYINHDLIVNQSIAETGFPLLPIKLGNAQRRKKVSPVYGAFDGLPPLLVVASEHECCFDQCILLVNRARESNVNCTLGVWKYMCHVFPVLSPFIPEGKQAQDFMCDWMRSTFDTD